MLFRFFFKCNCLVQIPRLVCAFHSLLSCLIVPKSWNAVYIPACTHFRFAGKRISSKIPRLLVAKSKSFFYWITPLSNGTSIYRQAIWTIQMKLKQSWCFSATNWRLENKSREGIVFMLRFLLCTTAEGMSCHMCSAVTRSGQDKSRRLSGNRIQADDSIVWAIGYLCCHI